VGVESSKRTPLKMKYKVIKKVRDFKKKMRKVAKKTKGVGTSQCTSVL
jgi:hypothetical protein